MSGIHRGWTEERAKTLAVLWTQGLSAAQISRELMARHGERFSRNAIIGKVHRLGLPGRISPELIAERKRAAGERRNRKAERSMALKAAPRIKRVVEPRDHLETKEKRVRFMDRARNQCPRHFPDESGPEGFICAANMAIGERWCANCARVIWAPSENRKVA